MKNTATATGSVHSRRSALASTTAGETDYNIIFVLRLGDRLFHCSSLGFHYSQRRVDYKTMHDSLHNTAPSYLVTCQFRKKMVVAIFALEREETWSTGFSDKNIWTSYVQRFWSRYLKQTFNCSSWLISDHSPVMCLTEGRIIPSDTRNINNSARIVTVPTTE